MRENLIKLLDNSYAPYSNFHVACYLEMNDGRLKLLHEFVSGF